MGYNILFVDDEETFHEVLPLFLARSDKEHTFSMHSAKNGKEGVEMYSKLRSDGQKPDLVLMDLRMPVMDGAEATRRIMENDPEAKIYLFTAYAGTQIERDALNAGAKGTISKSADWRRTVEKIKVEMVKIGMYNPLLARDVSEKSYEVFKHRIMKIDNLRESATMKHHQQIDTLSDSIRWSWACRILNNVNYYRVNTSASQPKVGDLALVKVEEIGKHSKIMTINNKRLRIYVGDLFVGVFGNRYASDAFEGVVDGLHNLSLLTAGGMIGTVKSKHGEIKNPTRVSFVGFISNGEGHRINLKELKFHKSVPKSQIKNLIVIVGTKMDSGKTTSSTKLIKGFSEKGVRVAACKLTGSVSHRDQDEMISAAATFTTDFSDYGFPSTYLCSKQELIDLFYTMLSDVEKMNVDVAIMEIADGILQRETVMLLEDPSIKQMIKGIVLTAECAPSALYGVEKLKKLNYNIIAISGTITSSPLSVREFREHSKIQVGSSKGSGKELVNIVKSFIEKER